MSDNPYTPPDDGDNDDAWDVVDAVLAILFGLSLGLAVALTVCTLVSIVSGVTRFVD
jgi:hypothetical protein